MYRRFTLLLLIVVSAIITYLLATPSTGWLVRSQISMFATPPRSFTGMLEEIGIKETSILPGEVNAARKAMKVTAAQHPVEPEIQLAFAAMGAFGSPEPHVDRVHPLLARFPDNPFILANYMRYACMGQISVHRPEESLLTADKPSAVALMGTAVLPNPLADYLNAADTGERLEPDNAYFPMLKCVALFRMRRDKEALETLHRAAYKARYYEHIDREIRARWRLARLAYGETSAVSHLATMASILYPHYAQLRGVARTATYLAAEAERVGNREKGLRIRMDLMNFSARMRLDSNVGIGTMVAVGMENISMSRPGGAPPVKRREGAAEDAAVIKRRKEFESYLNEIGHGVEARWAAAELDAGAAAKDIVSAGVKKYPFGGSSLAELIRSWTMGMLLISNGVWLAVIFAAGCVFSRVARGRSGGLNAGETGMIIGVCGGCLLMLMGLLSWQQARSIDAFNQLGNAIAMMMSADGTGNIPNQIGTGGFLAGAVALPTFVMIASAFGSLFRRKAALESFFVGLRGCTPILLCLVSVGYLFTVRATLELERRTNVALSRGIEHEGKNLAALEGKPWPGIIPFPGKQ